MTVSIPRRRLRFAAALLAGSALAAGAAGWPAIAEQAASPIVAAPAAPGAMLPSFADLAARVRPAVVTITATQAVSASSTASPFPPGSPQGRMWSARLPLRSGTRTAACGPPARA